jgi:CubicO group peptidase (beta-lactamase class C family)
MRRGTLGMVLLLVTRGITAQGVVPSSETRAIDSLAHAFVAAAEAPSVAIAVVRGTDTLAMAGFGVADLENDVVATDRSVYDIGSVTKQFTAAIVLQLRDEGAFALDDSIARYVSGLPVAWRPVTIRQLLNHTGGVPDYTSLGPSWQRRWGEQMAPDTVLALTFGVPMMFPPGSSWRYDNTGYVLLGVLIERVTGHSWQQEVTRRLTAPLGLTDTQVCLNPPVIPRRVHGYEKGPGGAGWINTPYLAMTQPYAAGALCSTVRDLTTWNHALHGGRVIGAASYRDMVTATGAALPTGYGFGMVRGALAGHPVLRHGGGINGFAAANAWIPDARLSLTVLTNSGSARATALLDQLARVALGAPLDTAAVPRPLPPEERDRIVGVYALELPGGARDFTVAVAGDGVTGQLVGQGANPMIYLGDHTFGMAFDPSLRIRFTLDGDRATGLTLEQGGAVYPATRVVRP